MFRPSRSAGFPAVPRVGFVVGLLLLAATAPVEAQERGRDRGTQVAVDIVFSMGDREAIRDFYQARPAIGAEGLPPGIRKRLARGKPLPPGIAKRGIPDALAPALTVPQGYDVVEVGWDVLLVEVATGIIHDVLMDVIR